MNVWGKMKKVSVGSMFVGAMMLVSSFSVTGCLTDEDKDADTTKVVPKDTLKSATVQLGAQDNADYGSFIDVDKSWEVIKLTPAKAVAADIDLIFAYSGSAKAAALYSPKTARDGVTGGAGGFDFVKTGFDALVATEIKTVDAAKLAAAKTQAGLDSLHAAGAAAPEGRLTLSNGVTFTVKSTKGVVFGGTVSDLVVTASNETKATVKVKGLYK